MPDYSERGFAHFSSKRMDAPPAQRSLQARARAALIALNFFAETNRMEVRYAGNSIV